MKFGRNYFIQIQTPEGDVLEIAPPFSAKIDITRNTLASTNTCNITLYNLKSSTRNRIYKDRYNIAEYWQIVVMAGYTRLETIFQGNIYQSFSTKQNVDWITTLECFDGLYGIQNGNIAETISAGTSYRDLIPRVIKTMPNMVAGKIGKVGDLVTGDRGQVMIGQSTNALQELTDGNYFIDKESVYCLQSDEVLSGSVLVLDSNQLFETPKRSDTFLECPILFLPEATVGLICELRSKEKVFDGQYKTIGFKHSVSILGNAAGEAMTTISLYAGATGLREV